MRKTTSEMYSLAVCLIVSCLAMLGCGGEDSKAEFLKVSGVVEKKLTQDSGFAPAKEKEPLFRGSAVRTQSESSANILLANRGIIEVLPDSYFELTSAALNVRQDSGTIIYRINENKSGFSVKTPHGETAVLGTVFSVTVSVGATEVGVKEGKVSLTNSKGEVHFVEPNEKITLNASGVFGKKTAFDLPSGGFKCKKENGIWLPVNE